MTDMEFDELKAKADAAWERVRSAKAAYETEQNAWHPLHLAVEHETLRRQIKAELEADKQMRKSLENRYQ